MDGGERLGLALLAEELDLESGKAALGEQDHDGIVVVHYLHRPLFRELARALKPGGLLVYETFTVQQAALGRPRSPRFLLEPGELARLVAPLEVLRQREGEFEGCCVAGVVARRRPV